MWCDETSILTYNVIVHDIAYQLYRVKNNLTIFLNKVFKCYKKIIQIMLLN